MQFEVDPEAVRAAAQRMSRAAEQCRGLAAVRTELDHVAAALAGGTTATELPATALIVQNAITGTANLLDGFSWLQLGASKAYEGTDQGAAGGLQIG